MGESRGALRWNWGAPVCFAIGIASLLAGCIRPAPPADLVIVNGTEPESLDPAVVTGVSEMRITKGLFEGLLRLDGKTARPAPGLAEKWDRSADGKTYLILKSL